MILKGFPANGFPKKKESSQKRTSFYKVREYKMAKDLEYGNKSQKDKINPMGKGQMPFECGKSAKKGIKNPEKGGSNALKNVAKCQKGV